MTKNPRTKWLKVERLLLVAAGVLLLMMIWKLCPHEEKQPTNPQQEDTDVHIYQKVTNLALTDSRGEQIHPLEESQDVKVLLFWASWCPHCKDSIRQADQLQHIAEEHGAKLWLIDKLDGEKETREQAVKFLEEQQPGVTSLFDEECREYKRLGLHMIPTVLVVDKNDRILSVTEGSIPSQEQLSAMIQEAHVGKAASLESLIERTLLNHEGGLRTNYLETEAGVPSGNDVLSESQGILLEYAARKGRTELFERVWDYTQTKMTEQGLMPWVMTGRNDTTVNALVDDLRIIGALQVMNRKTAGDWKTVLNNYYDAVYIWNTQDGSPVDFYDSEYNQKADRFTLCYGDFATLSQMKTDDGRFKEIYDRTLELVLGGQISKTFPLYYSYYDYTMGKYTGSELNMAEGLTTLLHLAEVGELPQPALQWLEQEMEKGCIYAAYNKDGRPAKDGYYESTAVYAIVAMIALEAGRERLAGQAVNRMEQLRIREDGNAQNGLFGNVDGSGIYFFDQGMALLAYELYERITE